MAGHLFAPLPMASQWRGTLLPVHTGTIGSHVRQTIARRGKVAAEPERPPDLLGDQRKLCCQSSIIRDPVDYRSYRHPEPGAYHIRMAHTVVVTSRQCFAFNAPLLAAMIAICASVALHKLAPAQTPGDSGTLCATSMTRSDDVLSQTPQSFACELPRYEAKRLKHWLTAIA